MKFVNENSAKSRNGGRLQRLFTQRTGIKTAKESSKATFINKHNEEELIDYDFFLQVDDVDVLIDVTTTYRLCRCKQKYYSGLVYKMFVPRKSFYIVAVENFEGQTPSVKHGADLLIDTESLINHINNGTLKQVIDEKFEFYDSTTIASQK